MPTGRNLRRTDLFLLRLWAEETGEGKEGEREWHGKVQRVVDGEAHYFRDWSGLVDLLLMMLQEKGSGRSDRLED